MRRLLPAVLVAVCLALAAGAAAATLRGTAGPDRISAANGRADTIRCGAGADVVVADLADRVAADCETVSRRISQDTTSDEASQHRTELEVSAAASGSTVVSAFQVGRYAGGGATAIGFAASLDAGRTWRSGLLPALTVGSAPAGTWARASDPAVAYDAAHGTWLVATLGISDDASSLLVSRSTDGRSWQPPVTVASATGPLSYDKEWLACDDGAASPFRGSCYLAFSDETNGGIAVQVSRDGGATWAPPVTAAPKGADVVGAQPAVQPDGTLVVAFDRGDGALDAVRSRDGGASFEPEVQVSAVDYRAPSRLRAPALPSIAVGAAGRLFLAWPDCRFHPGCTADDVVLSHSDDGLSWSVPARAAAVPAGSVAFVPALGADPSGRLAVAYYVLGGSRIGVRLARSRDGAAWSALRRLDAVAMDPAWLARAPGPFLGDYVAIPFAAGVPVPLYALATAPANESIFAVSWLR